MLSECNAGNPSPCSDTFSFDVNDVPKATLNFTQASIAHLTSTAATALKRNRPATDVDGEGSEHKQKKKRRLRLNLITSRLSQPYATPTTYIVGRGNTKVRRKLQKRYSGLNILRMAALINSTRVLRSRESLEDVFQYPIEDSEIYEESFEAIDERNCLQRSARLNVPRIPRSPLGLTDYDAIDREDFSGDDDDSDDERSDSDQDSVNSNVQRREYTQTPMPNYNAFLPKNVCNLPSLSRKPSLEEINALVMEEEESEDIPLALLETSI